MDRYDEKIRTAPKGHNLYTWFCYWISKDDTDLFGAYRSEQERDSGFGDHLGIEDEYTLGTVEAPDQETALGRIEAGDWDEMTLKC